jgi:hypothetical protein
MARLVGKLGRLKGIGWVCLVFSAIGERFSRDIRGTFVGHSWDRTKDLATSLVVEIPLSSVVGWRLDHGRRLVQPWNAQRLRALSPERRSGW